MLHGESVVCYHAVLKDSMTKQLQLLHPLCQRNVCLHLGGGGGGGGGGKSVGVVSLACAVIDLVKLCAVVL